MAGMRAAARWGAGRAVLVALVACQLPVAPATAGTLDAARQAFAAANAALAPHDDGFGFLDDAPASPALLRARWQAWRAWAVDFLTDHPAAAAPQLAQALGALGQDVSAEAVGLSPGVFLVSMSFNGGGDVFVVAASGGGPRIVWSLGEATPAAGPLRAWSAEAAATGCRTARGDGKWAECGPLDGSIGRLPDSGAGQPRFYVNATYLQLAGETVAGQLGVWTWTGAGATPLLTRTYSYMLDQPQFLRVSGGTLKLRVKDEFKTFFACGACEGRQLDWTLRLTPAGVDDLGRVSLTPELDLVDQLFDRAFHGRPLADIASPSVAAAVSRKAAAIRRSNAGLDNPATLGMLDGFRISGPPAARVVCLATDGGGTFRFTLAGGRAVAMRDLGDAQCG
jgi:hypothetical protein